MYVYIYKHVSFCQSVGLACMQVGREGWSDVCCVYIYAFMNLLMLFMYMCICYVYTYVCLEYVYLHNICLSACMNVGR